MIAKPTFHFNGRYAEAVALYKEAFGCEVLMLLYTNGDPYGFLWRLMTE